MSHVHGGYIEIKELEMASEEFTGVLKVIDNDHAYIHQEKMFVAYDKAVIASGGTIEYAYKTPVIGYIHYRLAGINPSADKVETFFYRDAIFTGGTELESNNKNDNSIITAGMTITKSPTFSDDGDLLPGHSSYLPGSTGVGQSRVGTNGQADTEIVLKQDTVYRFVIENGSTSTNTIGVNFRWYEELLG